jgi:G:T-mismatch repair DNA endonuclease (very short patch repair protein)
MEKWTCRFCTESLEFKNKFTQSGHLAKCMQFKNWKIEKLTKEFLISEYIETGKSALEIANELGFNSSSVIDRMLAFLNIEKRTISSAKLMKRCKDKTATTNIERYGAPNVYCKESSSRKKWEQRLWDEEGIINVFQRPSVVLRFSKPHRKVVDFLITNGIKVDIEFAIKYKDGQLTNSGHKFYDISINGTKLLIEVNGDYWHASPLKYKESDVFFNKWTASTLTAKEIWNRDAEKIKIAIDAGFKVLVLWEHEIKDGTYEKRLWEYLRLN